MVAKTMWLAMVAIGVMAVSGLGFAAFTASANVSVQATAGSLSLGFGTVTYQTSVGAEPSWDNTYTTGCNGAATTVSAGSLSVGAGNYAPGDWCWITVDVINTGSVPATYTVSSSTSAVCGSPGSTYGCTGGSVVNCWQSVVLSPTEGANLAVGGHVTVSMGIEVSDEGSGAGNSCEGSVGTLTLTLSATSASVGEGGEPSSAL